MKRLRTTTEVLLNEEDLCRIGAAEVPFLELYRVLFGAVFEGLNPSRVRVSKEMWTWLLETWADRAPSHDAKAACGFIFVDKGPGCDEDLADKCVVRVIDYDDRLAL